MLVQAVSPIMIQQKRRDAVCPHGFPVTERLAHVNAPIKTPRPYTIPCLNVQVGLLSFCKLKEITVEIFTA